MSEIFLDGKLDRVNLPDDMNTKDFNVLNVSAISVLTNNGLELVNSRKQICLPVYVFVILFLGFITMATNTTGDVSYISIVSHLENGNSSEFIVLHSTEAIVLYQRVCVCLDYYKLHLFISPPNTRLSTLKELLPFRVIWYRE